MWTRRGNLSSNLLRVVFLLLEILSAIALTGLPLDGIVMNLGLSLLWPTLDPGTSLQLMALRRAV